MKNSIYKDARLLFAVFILHFSLLIPNCMSDWVLVGSGLALTTFTSLTANTNTIFAGAMNGRVYLTTNNGANWTQSLLISDFVFSLAANGNDIFAGGYNERIYYSSNNGTSWSPTSLTLQTVNALAINGNKTFAGVNQNGVYYTINNGANWTQSSLNNRSVLSFAVKGDTIFAGTYNQGVYISTDNGATWNQTSLNNRICSTLAVNGNYIYAGTSGTGVYISTDNGSTWTQSSLTGPSINSLAVYGNNVFAGTYGAGFYASTDNGTSWTQRNKGLGGMFVRALCISNNYIFACPDSRVYRRPLGELTGIQSISNEIPIGFSLSQNYPNPFNPSTIIEFQIANRGLVNLSVYDVPGNVIQTLVNEELNAGTYRTEFNASHLSSGAYFYRLEADGVNITKKMVLLK